MKSHYKEIASIAIENEEVKDRLADLLRYVPFDELGQSEAIEKAIEHCNEIDRLLGVIDI